MVLDSCTNIHYKEFLCQIFKNNILMKISKWFKNNGVYNNHSTSDRKENHTSLQKLI